MYSILQYGLMVADKTRIAAYAQALRSTIHAGSTVLDLGAGTGIFSLLACKFGARKVYAVDSSDVIDLAEQIADANGMADRIEFIQGVSTDVSLPEKADVIVSDMRGALPFLTTNIASIMDARRRMLARDGVLIPKRDTLWAAVVEVPKVYEQLESPWAKSNFGLNMDAARMAATNYVRRLVVAPEQLLSGAECWGSIDYATVESNNFSAVLQFRAARAGVAHGIILWYDSILADGVEMSNAPGKTEMISGGLFLPWTQAVPLNPHDQVSIRLRADLSRGNYIWTWLSEVNGKGSKRKANFRQSTFWSSPPSRLRLRKRDKTYKPMLAEEERIDAEILAAMNGSTPLEDIALAVLARFPARFRSVEDALARVQDLSESYDRGNGSLPATR